MARRSTRKTIKKTQQTKERMPYGTARWQKLRAAQLAKEPLCAMCIDKPTPATVCDHIEPHRGDIDKFWAGPFQSLCAHHHNTVSQSLEKGGKYKPQIAEDGWPVEPDAAMKKVIEKKTSR